ncbi:MAG: pyridoxamine 5'-phosphate oxidase family protein [Anaerolineae bacterium]|nr:pyridoxamine 5'-phosphate oxidase family protein [Anaerolineae bacterium]
MTKLPEAVQEAWQDREGPIVFTTVDAAGMPNAIWASCVGMFDDEHLVVADNYFNKTQANIQAGSPGSILFITKEGKSYQVKGTITYETSGVYYEDMKSWNAKRPGHAAAVLRVSEVHSGAERIA